MPAEPAAEPPAPPRPWLRWTHLLVGIAGLLAFAETGRFMDQQLGHLFGMADAPRTLYRSAHIYLLLCALIHFVLGLYFERAENTAARAMQILGSAALLAALAGFLYGFYVETPLVVVERPVVRLSIYSCLAGVLLHGIARTLPGR